MSTSRPPKNTGKPQAGLQPVVQRSHATQAAISFVQKFLEMPPPNDIFIQELRQTANQRTVQEIYIQLRKQFTSATLSPLRKLAIIHFFQNTQDLQKMIDPTKDFADNFVSHKSTQRWQRAFLFKAVSALIPTIRPVSSLNPTIRSDTLFLMKAIDNLSSSDPEVFESAKEVLQKLAQKINIFSHIYLQCIIMPYLLLFLPDMTYNSEIINQIISIYLSMLTLENPHIHETLDSIEKFVKNLKVFPQNLYSAILNFIFSFPEIRTSHKKPFSYCVQIIEHIFRIFENSSNFLMPYQIQNIADFAVNYILHTKKKKNSIVPPLKMLVSFLITDNRLNDTPAEDVESAAYLIAVFPRLNEENSEIAEKGFNTLRDFADKPFPLHICELLLNHLGSFIPYLSEEAHSIIIEVLLPNLTSQSQKHQEAVASFLSTITIDFSPMYLELIKNITNIQICPKLKAALLSLHYLATTQPDKQFAKIAVTESYECGRSLFLIGEFSQASRLWVNDESAEAFRIFASGETFYHARDHSKAASEFKIAADAFKLTKFPHDFHVFYCMARHYYESICFQAELLMEMPSIEPIATNIIDIIEFNDILFKLGNSSLLLHPEIDRASRDCIEEFIQISQRVLQSLEQSREVSKELYKEATKQMIIPPPAFLSTKQPVSIQNLKITQPDIFIIPAATRQFFLELIGTVQNQSNLEFSLTCEVVITLNGIPKSVQIQDIPSEGDFSVDFPIMAEEKHNHESVHHMPVTITFTACFNDNSKYLIEYAVRYIVIHESSD
ncbi:hypothetical protein TRFO_17134 [Tritrichomonas foetus]|uniref:Integrator complex subunit 7 n=1 Tax=Tritrichomonas foetus TaxID=1144522 RepID=A0A1J4KNI4_9EUKA|nr:hypothetical protein TRFO_17134 [Tritrichomonas foetus]|eukprot:OHT12873.1 hypothetical protein TRFO_17134 [Tritrichomonas foetus]